MDNSILELLTKFLAPSMFGQSQSSKPAQAQNQNSVLSSYPPEAYSQNQQPEQSTGQNQNILALLSSLMGKNGNINILSQLLSKTDTKKEEEKTSSVKDELLL